MKKAKPMSDGFAQHFPTMKSAVAIDDCIFYCTCSCGCYYLCVYYCASCSSCGCCA